MEYGYLIRITGQNFYKEAQLSTENSSYTIGTKLDSNLRFRKNLFFEDFQLSFVKAEGQWSISCSDNIFLDFGDIRKLATKQLEHGDVFSVKYRDSDNELFKIEFVFDFENGKKDYSRVVDISSADQIIIGVDPDANLQLEGEYLKGACFELHKKADSQYGLKIRKPGYGVYKNGSLAKQGSIIKNGDFISLANFSFYLKDQKLYTSTEVKVVGLNYSDSPTPENYPKFNRNTRLKTQINEESIEVLDPPPKPQKPSSNVFIQLLPAFAMVILIVFLRGFMGNSSNSSFLIFSVATMSIGVITSIANIISERKKYKKDIQTREVKYKDYIENKKSQISKSREDELNRLENVYISPKEELENIKTFSGDIFDKTKEDADFIKVRIGRGTVEARRKISYKKKETFESEDPLKSLPEEVSYEFKNIEDAPVALDLKEDHVVGVVGDEEDNYLFVKNLVLDIVARHYYKDVQVFFLIDEDQVQKYASWLRWLPHVLDKENSLRNIVYDDDSKSIIFERLYVEFTKRIADTESEFPHYIVFVLKDWGIKTHPVAQYLSQAEECRTSYFFFEDKKEKLPLWCDKLIRLEADCAGTIVSTDNKDSVGKFTYPKIEDALLVKAAKMLSPIYCEEINLENSLTKNITLYEMLNILSVDDIDLEKNWSQAQIYKTMAAPIGVKTKNEIVYLDLHEKAHGPHGLVAGTTGSGKSELLQTYILCMSILYHPYEVGFVVIDFKGGGMVNQFKDLPHLIGAITNIDGKEINRSLMSIKAELEKRQRVFAQYNVNSINKYIQLYKSGKADTPIPHLIIIVDEFAELKAEQPEFMKELISTARIGRSLGVHLILATQKPAGQVNEQIWSNSKFKLCLKVQTKEDSNEVLKSPLAAEIKEPGRAYLQVGNNEIFELFQSAYSGAPNQAQDATAEKQFEISEVNLLGKRKTVFKKSIAKDTKIKETQLDAVVKYVNDYCKKAHIQKLPNICLPALQDLIEYKNPGKLSDENLIIPIGIYDDPAHQAQKPASIDISDGNTVIIGSAQYGKTNLLQLVIRSLAENYKASEINIYILDFGSMALKSFESLNHVGGVVVSSEDERVKNLFRMLTKEMDSRKERFAHLGITSFNSYLEAGYRDIPQIVLLLDNFIAFKELYPDYDDEMLNLCREGVSFGISIIMTSLQTNGISYKYMTTFSNRIALFCNSKDEYSVLFDRCKMEPKAVPGRGLMQIEKEIYEVQTYLAFNGEREIDRVAAIQEFITDRNAENPGLLARPIPAIPRVLDSAYIKDKKAELADNEVIIGLDYEFIDFQILNLSRMGSLGISGRENSGKTNLVKLIFNHCLDKVFDYPTKAYIIDDYNREMAQFANYGFVEKYTVDSSALEVILPEMEEELERRKDRIKDEGPDFLKDEPLLLCAIENPSIFENGVLSKETIEIYKRLTTSYKDLKVLFIFTNIPNVNISYAASDMLKQMKELNTLIITDDLANVKIRDFNAATLRQYKKPIELGDAYYIMADGSISKIRIVKADERSEIG